MTIPPASTYYEQAVEVFDRGELDPCEELCLKAAKLYEQARNDEVSNIYFRLGLVAYRQGNFDSAVLWYRKALRIEEAIGDEHSAANTYYYLSTAMDSQGDLESAEKWARRSLRIREKQGNEIGVAERYHRPGLPHTGKVTWTLPS